MSVFEGIKKEHLLQAIERIDEEGFPPNRRSNSYDLCYNNIAYPPKYILSLAGYLANERFISHSEFSGGEKSEAFNFLRSKDFIIKPKSETKELQKPKETKWVHKKYWDVTANELNEEKSKSLFVEYYNYCQRSPWLSFREKYKFKFGRWLNERVDFNSMTDNEILKICIDSQNQKFYEGSNEKGVNFIKSALQYNDEFISIGNIASLRSLFEDGKLEEDELQGTPVSFPKFSCWAGTLIPQSYNVYANEELTNGLAYLFELSDYPKSGLKSFNLAMDCLSELSSFLTSNFPDQIKQLIFKLFPADSTIREVDKSWLTQDFILFLNRRILNQNSNYYWINQGDKYDQELETGCIAAPTSSHHGHKRLMDLFEGDILVHYANGSIKATSVVKKEFEIKPRPYEKSDDDYVVEVKYNVLENSINSEKFKSIFEGKPDILPKKYGPLTNKFGVVQAYCLQFNEKSFNALINNENYSKSTAMESTGNNPNLSLNTILYGPPGTGKTYNTINKAIEICNNSFNLDQPRPIVKHEFERLVNKGQIAFTTFHQSMSYEDFVEGIKPKLIDGNEQETSTDVQYEVRDGILKSIVQKINDESKLEASAKRNLYIPEEYFEQDITKVSLGNSLVAEDQAIYDYCIENDCIAIGFGEDIDFSGVKTRQDIRQKYKEAGIEFETSMDFNISAIERLVLWMNKGQLVFVSNGNFTLRSIGVVDGDYYCDPNSPIAYSQFRKVKWLHLEVDIPIKEIYKSRFSQQTIYQIDKKSIDKKVFKKDAADVTQGNNNFVLIIDEINRGNVSQIFGELITLLEDDKRKGRDEAIELTLPYSQSKFSVPENLHIIGTMNTADRSVEALDTALRRRFSFIEMLPEPALITSDSKSKGNIEGISLEKLLATLNERIEVLVDRDHTIGHAFFMNIQDWEDLREVFANKIIPLLQEYFYGNYNKMELVIGPKFFIKTAVDKVVFAVDSEDSYEGDKYAIKAVKEMQKAEFLEALAGIKIK